MPTKLLESGKEVGPITGFLQAALVAGQTPSCSFNLPRFTPMRVGGEADHALLYPDGSAVPIRIIRVAGGMDWVKVSALLVA